MGKPKGIDWYTPPASPGMLPRHSNGWLVLEICMGFKMRIIDALTHNTNAQLTVQNGFNYLRCVVDDKLERCGLIFLFKCRYDRRQSITTWNRTISNFKPTGHVACNCCDFLTRDVAQSKQLLPVVEEDVSCFRGHGVFAEPINELDGKLMLQVLICPLTVGWVSRSASAALEKAAELDKGTEYLNLV